MASLTAELIGRELLLFLDQGVETAFVPETMPRGGRHAALFGRIIQHTVVAWISPEDLSRPLEPLRDNILMPMAAMFREVLPAGAHYQELALPKGVVDAAVVQYCGRCVRIIVADAPTIYPPFGVVPPSAWREPKRYYDINEDQWNYGDCGLVIRADMVPVETPHAAVG